MPDTDRPKTEQIHNKRVSGMSRRRLMKTLTAVGFSATTAAYLTADDVKAAAGDEVPITYAMVWDDSEETYEPEKKMVPADWYNDLQQAHKVHQQANFIQRPGVSGTTVKPGKYGGRNARIQVEISQKKADNDRVAIAEARGEIPESIEGVPIDVVEAAAPELGCYENDYGDTPPAGVHCGDDDSSGSLGAYMIKNGNEYFSTNHHILGGDPTGEHLYQYSATPIGEVVSYNCHDDYVAAKGINGHSPSRDIVDSSYYTWGHWTAAGVDDLAAQGAYAEKRGVRTCWTTGEIHGRGDAWVYDSNCVIRHDQVKWGTAVDDFYRGDSGSAAYHHYEDDKVLVVDLNAAFVPESDPSGDYVFGTGAYHIYNEYGFGW